MRCPFCRHRGNRVIDSRLANDGTLIRRRRACSGCKRRFTTYERVEEAAPMVVKKDDRREPFDRAKIVALRKEGLGATEIARAVGCKRGNVYKALKAAGVA